MILRLLVKIFFGSIWNLKNECKYATHLGKFAKLLYQSYQYENNSDVAWNSKFKSEPCFPHGMKGVFVSGDAIVGENCILFQHVTIGSVMIPGTKKGGAPLIGDNVYIGAGAKIIGGVKIGDNVRIGANAVVYKDVASNSVVVSGEQRVLCRADTMDNRFYSFHGKWVLYDRGSYEAVKDKKIISQLEEMRH